MQPGVPANVEIKLEHLPNSDKSQIKAKTFSGKANRFGYFIMPQEKMSYLHFKKLVNIVLTTMLAIKTPMRFCGWAAEAGERCRIA